jgi:hypothetical protein
MSFPSAKVKPYFSKMPYVGNLLIGGWSLNAVTTFQTGFPHAIYMNNNGNSSLGTARQRPNATAGRRK